VSYSVKEVFLTLQGEGLRAGTKTVFVRFAGCNLWDGHPEHRARGAGPCARWCDTDFFKGTRYSAEELERAMATLWPAGGERWCVLTGGEPGLQIDEELATMLAQAGWSCAVETNGTIANTALGLLDHVCLSPKYGTPWRMLGANVADEIKVVLPGAVPGDQGWTESELLELEGFTAGSLYVQPQDEGQGLAGVQGRRNLRQCIEWVQSHPRWRLSLQQHKLIGLP
jgi:7-carboxy-7-deazaguanine synthase